MVDQLAVHADDLSLGYGHRPAPAVDGLSFSVRAGEVVGVLGSAGSGKSTLARAVAASGPPGKGTVPHFLGGSLTVLGVDLRRARARGRDSVALRVGHLPSDAGATLDPALTVGENVAMPIYSRDRRFNRVDAGGAVASLLDAVRLPLSIIPRFPSELSRGQRQRVAIARSLVLEPELLIADDPTVGVDMFVRPHIIRLLAKIQRERGFAAIVIGHDVRELRELTDSFAVLHAGMLLARGPIDEILAEPSHPYLRDLAKVTSARRDRRLTQGDTD